jgi:hypothetical protein
MMIVLAVNAIGPFLVGREFAAARDSSALEGAYFVGFLIGQPVALLTLGFEFIFLAAVWRSAAGETRRFASWATVAALPATGLLAWPQISVVSSLFLLVSRAHDTAGWIAGLVLGTAVLSALVFLLAMRVARRTTIWRRVRSGILAAALLPIILALITAPLWFSAALHGTWYAFSSIHLAPKEAQPGQRLTGSVLGSPCGVAANGRFLGMYTVSDNPPLLIRSDEVSGASSTQVFIAQKELVAPCGVATDWAGDVFVADGGASKVFVVRDDGYGSFVLRGSIGGPLAALKHPRRIALDGQRNVYVLSQDSISVFRRRARGNVRPMRVLSGPSMRLGACTGFAVDWSGEIFLANCGGGGSAPPYIAVLPAGAAGDAKPSRVIVGPHTTLGPEMPLAVDPRGDVVTLSGGQDVVAFSAGTRGDVPPQILLSGPLGVSEPADLSLGGDEVPSLFVADHGGRTTTIFEIGTGPLALEKDSAMEPLSP